MTQLPTLPAQRVRLRHLVQDDVPALYEIFSNREVMRYWGFSRFENIEEAQALLEQIHEGCDAEKFYQWGIASAENDELMGTTTLWNLDLPNRRCELGFALAHRFWGHGYAMEALTTLLDYAFGPFKLHRMEADVDPRNEASIRTLERLGFQKEGYLRERWLHEDGADDSIFYGLLGREWQTRSS